MLLRPHLRSVALALVFILALPAFAATDSASKLAGKTYEKDIKPILSEFCFSCHDDKKHKGDVVLDKYKDEAALMADRATWQKVLENVQSRAMPPDNKPQPREQDRELLMQWLEERLFAVDCNNPDPGRVTIRRLNRSEYNNTIRDLVGVDFHPADDFPADDVGYGFDSIGDVLSMPPVLLEKYMAAADKILDRAIVVAGAEPKASKYPAVTLAGTQKAVNYTSKVRSLTAEEEIYLDHFCAAAGEYQIRVRAFQDQAGTNAARMAIRAASAGKNAGTNNIREFDVKAREQRPETYEATIRLDPGTNRIAIAFLNPFTVTNLPSTNTPRRDRRITIRTRRLLVEEVQVVEPTAAPVAFPESHRRLFACHPDQKHQPTCGRVIVTDFARRAFRRPVNTNEVDRLMRIYDMAQKNGEPFERCVQVTLSAVLVSPHFLFRGEITPEPNNPKSVHQVNEFALASRLSYFLWSSMPDEELFNRARRGELRKRGIMEREVTRMLKDPKAKAFVENFTGQWLQTRNLWKVTPDTNVFSGFTDELRADMEKETQLFFAAVMKEDRSVLDFIDGRYTFVNERLAKHYGIEGVQGSEFRKVSFMDKARGGVLTHGSVLTITSNPTRTSPVKRGKWVLDNLLGTPPPPAPPGVPELKEGKELTGTLRQRLEQHRADPSCASCHERMDPIGFGLENFDAVGVWREKDHGEPIDPSGKLPSGAAFAGPADLRGILRQQKDLFAHCLAEKMLTYALGRGLEYYDKCAADKITTSLARNNYKFSVLISEIVKSAPFQLKRGDSDGAEVAAASQ